MVTVSLHRIADAARSHHHFDRNTPHAASVNNARLTSAPTSAITHAAPPGGLLVPANDEVIHKNVLPYTSSVAAAMFRRVLCCQPRLSVCSLVLVP
jgi:hypothetical protein